MREYAVIEYEQGVPTPIVCNHVGWDRICFACLREYVRRTNERGADAASAVTAVPA